MIATQLLVVGAGPYALSTAAFARERGIDTTVVGRPMAFWRENMPEGMFLRSGPDWHLDAAHIHTLDAFLEERGIAPEDVDPIPIGVFLDYAKWFQEAKGIDVREELVADLEELDGGFRATLAKGEPIAAEAVVCAPGIRHYTNLPQWAPSVPPDRAAHTCDLVRLDELAGMRVVIVGGRQSAYEWAALLREHGAERIDIVHRHDVPRFERVSWKFIDAHVERTIDVPGYWRHLPKTQQEAIARRFWEVGRLTLEYWLTSRLDWAGIHRWPGTEVVEVRRVGPETDLQVRLSNSERLIVDQVIFASGYRADLPRVPYLAGVLERLQVADGFPALDEAFGSSLAGLYVTGFSATRDFGPFFGFVKAAPAAATLIVRDLLRR
ncbi:MAG: FAD-dependent oxidoreductase [Thermoleophilaceae bacterium]|nr:FAD-dependent oxidoreductase [Thermoleophilaceae bacterium]